MKVLGWQNAKTTKGEKLGYLTGIRYLAPANTVETVLGVPMNTCPNAGECAQWCLYTSGRAACLPEINKSRIAKTVWRYTDRAGHLKAASKEIESAQKLAARLGLRLAVRLNGTSDLPADSLDLAARHRDVQFYDYTKLAAHAMREDLPANYHLTLSYDAQSVPWSVCEMALRQGVNVAMILPLSPGGRRLESFRGYATIDGDAHDLRFLDPKGVIVALTPKGDAKQFKHL